MNSSIRGILFRELNKLSEFRGKGLPSLSIENNGKKAEPYVEKWQKNRNAKIVFEFLTNSVYFQPIFFDVRNELNTLQFIDELRLNSNLVDFPVKPGHSSNCGAKAKFSDVEAFTRGLDKSLELFCHQAEKSSQEKNTRNVVNGNVTSGSKGIEEKEDLNLNPSDDYVTAVVEGGKKKLFTYIYERNNQLRKQALRKYGYKCAACGFSFESFYGPELGENFIEVHHIVPVSEGERENDYTNLRPMCSNCHRMIHRLYRELEPKDYKRAIEILTSKIKKP